VTIAERGGRAVAGEDLYSADASGETRSMIIEDRLVLEVQVQDDGTGKSSYNAKGSPAASGFTVRYRLGRKDVTTDAVAGSLVLEHLRPGDARTLTIVVTADRSAPLGAKQTILVTAHSTTEPNQVDAVRADITKVSEPA
jgi:hypothetical protein